MKPQSSLRFSKALHSSEDGIRPSTLISSFAVACPLRTSRPAVQRHPSARLVNWWYGNSLNLKIVSFTPWTELQSGKTSVWRDYYRVVDDEPFPSNLRTPSDSASCMWLKARRHYFIIPLSTICQYHASQSKSPFPSYTCMQTIPYYGSDESILSPNDRLWFDKRFLF